MLARRPCDGLGKPLSLSWISVHGRRCVGKNCAEWRRVAEWLSAFVFGVLTLFAMTIALTRFRRTLD
jgi:hypothetical protein